MDKPEWTMIHRALDRRGQWFWQLSVHEVQPELDHLKVKLFGELDKILMVQEW